MGIRKLLVVVEALNPDVTRHLYCSAGALLGGGFGAALGGVGGGGYHAYFDGVRVGADRRAAVAAAVAGYTSGIGWLVGWLPLRSARAAGAFFVWPSFFFAW